MTEETEARAQIEAENFHHRRHLTDEQIRPTAYALYQEWQREMQERNNGLEQEGHYSFPDYDPGPEYFWYRAERELRERCGL